MLLKHALFNLKELFFVANIRGAGLISKTIIAPLWNTIEDKSIDLSQMSDIYSKLLKFLEEASVNPQIVLDGNSPFPERYLRKDKYWDKIFAPDQRFDALTLSALGMFLPVLAIFTKSHFADQLPGGRYADLQSTDVKGVPKHNKFCERNFGLWDMAKRQSPNKSEIAIEAALVYSCNGVAKYINTLDPEARRKFVLDSRAETSTLRAKFKERQMALKLAAEQALQHRKDKARADEQKRIQELVDLTVKINSLGGLWKTTMEVDKGLAKIKGAARGGGKGKLLEGMKTQLAFRKKILCQPLSDTKLWSYSEKGRAFDVDELSRRLKLVVAESPIRPTTPSTLLTENIP